MPNLLKYLLPLLIGLGLALLLSRGCDRGYNEALPPSGEQQLTRTVNTDSLRHAIFQQAAGKYQARISALQRDSAAAKSKDRQQTEKARQSAAKYAASGLCEDCRTALADCQEENGTKAYSLAVQDAMLTEFDSLSKLQGNEISRQGLVIDTLAAGWQQADTDVDRLTQDLDKQKRKRFGIGPNITGTLINGKPAGVIGVGIQYNLIRF